MHHLHDPARVAEVKARLATVRTDSPRQWGKMTAPQAVAHMAIGLEGALGDLTMPRMFLGRLVGRLVKKQALGNDAPFIHNAPTAPALIVSDARDLDRERARLLQLIDRFAAGPSACTTLPHPFFGPLTPDEWAVLEYKHLDHHLRQFGA
jgi:Protein of unknown function (DUF1569)